MQSPITHAVIFAVLLAAGSAQAQFYKCTVNGKTTFSDIPCAPDAEKIKIKSANGEDNAERAELIVSNTKKTSRRIELDAEIARRERELRELAREKDTKLAELQARKLRTYNNLAGATLEQSISTEMQAVATDYNARLDRAEKAISEAKAQRSALEKP